MPVSSQLGLIHERLSDNPDRLDDRGGRKQRALHREPREGGVLLCMRHYIVHNKRRHGITQRKFARVFVNE